MLANEQTGSSWALEIWALVGSLISFVELITLLVVFDGRAVFNWKGVTLNALVSTISVALKVSLLFSVSECIGQWKWIIFSQSGRELLDFERIDLASRGPLGSLKLLWRKNTPWILRLGVGVILLNIALEPFSQQLVQLEAGTMLVSEHSSGSAIAPRAVAYASGRYGVHNVGSSSSSNQTVHIGETRLDISMEAAILGALSWNSSVEQLTQQLPLQCPTGNCTWQRFDTLGVCHSCVDLTSEARLVNDMGNLTASLKLPNYDHGILHQDASAWVLPNGHLLPNIDSCFISNHIAQKDCLLANSTVQSLANNDSEWLPDISATFFGTGNQSQTNAMKHINTLIWSESIIYADFAEINERNDQWSRANGYDQHSQAIIDRPWNYWPAVPIRAEECALHYCVKSVETKVIGKQLQETTRPSSDVVRDPKSWKPGDDLKLVASENIPNDLNSLEFDPTRFIYMTPLELSYRGTTAGPSYWVADNSVKAISAYFQKRFSHNSWRLDGVFANEQLGDHPVGFNGALYQWGSYPENMDTLWYKYDNKSLGTSFEKIATSMTNEMRRGAQENIETQAARYNLTTGDPVVFGQVEVPTTLYRCEWYWIILHSVTLIGGVAFCGLTMMISSRHSAVIPTWKSSALAVMRQGPAVILQSATTIDQMKAAAKDSSFQVEGVELRDLGPALSS